MNPDRLAELEEERDFLLRSLADLEREHDAGDVEDDDYTSLRDGYTARAATVLRAIDEGRAALPPRRRTSPVRIAIGAVSVVAIGALSGWLVARYSGQRTTGQVMTGGAPVDQVSAKLTEARAKLGSDPGGALVLFQEVMDLEPDNAEARTYTAWLLAISSSSAATPETAALAAEGSRKLFREVIADQPTYADAHCLYAVANVRMYPEQDLELAKAEGQACLDNNPPAEIKGLVQPFLEALNAPATT